MMSRLRWLAILMIIAIFGITGFQVYWLQQNYAREKRALTIRSEMLFRETVVQLQVSKLKLDGAPVQLNDSETRNMKIIMHEKEGDQVKMRFKSGSEVVTSINIMRDKLKDTNLTGKKGMMISMNNSLTLSGDSNKRIRGFTRPAGKGDRFINLLYSMDSLQEPLRITEIDSAYSRTLADEKLSVPFSIIRKDSIDESEDPAFDEVTVGFSSPVTYRLELGNTFPYLFKQITQPILFSVLLLGITILSFALLYKNLLKQNRLAELKNEFISNITHELKTPIATVGVAIEALKNFNAINDQRRTQEYLDISQNELQRLGLLVDKVLKLSMFEKKEVDLKYETLNLGAIVDEVTASLKLQLEKYGAVLSVVKEGNLLMQGDRLHLLSVVFNLVDNALKYSRLKPQVDITVSEENDNILLKVKDNGVGIPGEYQEKVFEKFFRVPHGDTHNAPGYGLGLSYTSHVVKQHKGTVSVESQPGKGTSIIIRLPKNLNNPVKS